MSTKREIIDNQLNEIIAIMVNHPDGLTHQALAEKTSFQLNNKTMQRRLAELVKAKKIVREGSKKLTRYYASQMNQHKPVQNDHTTDDISLKNNRHLKDNSTGIFGKKSQKSLKFLDLPVYTREKVSYNRDFLAEYVPNKTIYVPKKIKDTLYQAGKRFDQQFAAGTYAKQICQRLLIDLSYHSSRLEGNTYSHLDTQKLVEKGISAEGKVQEETIMIMNHKEAILFLIENAQEIEFNSLTIRNLHHLLSQDLLSNPEACGNIRSIEVDIGRSTYKPLSNPHQLKENFELILQKAKKILDPFEQSFFLLIHLSYLQAFEDVNKRTSRLSCNMPFIKHNLCPLSFIDVSRDDYSAAVITVYEKNDIQPMLDLFVWAYQRSCQHYHVVKQSIGEIDAFRIQHRQQRKEVMGQVIRSKLYDQEAETLIESYCLEHHIEHVDKFIAMTMADLSQIHPGAMIGLGVTEGQLNAWLAEKRSI